MTSATATTAGEMLGKHLEVKNVGNKGMQRRKFLTVKVVIKLNHPLVPGFTHSRQDKPLAWIQLRYDVSRISILGVAD
jgi:hypothetical protein